MARGQHSVAQDGRDEMTRSGTSSVVASTKLRSGTASKRMTPSCRDGRYRTDRVFANFLIALFVERLDGKRHESHPRCVAVDVSPDLPRPAPAYGGACRALLFHRRLHQLRLQLEWFAMRVVRLIVSDGV